MTKRMTIAEYNRQQANTPEQPEPSATIQKFRREKKLAEDLAAELAVIRNAEPLQPGGQKANDAPKAKERLLPRKRRQLQNTKPYTKGSEPRKPKT
tara:strand:+ start:538 stop:825 length:288 start_codon:yes stop_codon:yes gene_type:complete